MQVFPELKKNLQQTQVFPKIADMVEDGDFGTAVFQERMYLP
jgi:hypothetical protein